MNPILPVKKKHTNANQVRDILMVIAPVYILKPFKMFVALAYDFLYQMAGILSAVPVGMDACSMELEGDMSELIQHEYDHLDGILATLRAVNERALVMKPH